MGTSSATLVRACSSRSAMGSGRSAGAVQAAWLSRGVLARAALPMATRSSTVKCLTMAGFTSVGALASTDCGCVCRPVTFFVMAPSPMRADLVWAGALYTLLFIIDYLFGSVLSNMVRIGVQRERSSVRAWLNASDHGSSDWPLIILAYLVLLWDTCVMEC